MDQGQRAPRPGGRSTCLVLKRAWLMGLSSENVSFSVCFTLISWDNSAALQTVQSYILHGLETNPTTHAVQSIKRSAIQKASMHKKATRDLKRQGIDIDKLRAEAQREAVFMTAEEREESNLPHRVKDKAPNFKERRKPRPEVKAASRQATNMSDDGADSEEQDSGNDSEDNSGDLSCGTPSGEAHPDSSTSKTKSVSAPTTKTDNPKSRQSRSSESTQRPKTTTPSTQPQPQQVDTSTTTPSSRADSLSRDRARKIMTKARGGQTWTSSTSNNDPSTMDGSNASKVFRSQRDQNTVAGSTFNTRSNARPNNNRTASARRQSAPAGPRKLSLESSVLLDRARRLMGK